MTEETLFTEALEIADLAERAAFLDRACGDDSALRARLDRLLTEHARAGSFLGRPAALPPAGVPNAPAGQSTRDIPVVPPSGGVVGSYKLVEVIGEGGMGTVWLAQQQEPVKRLVAIKVIKAGMDSRSVLARFEAERQALALMDHPNIAKVHDGGTTPDGRPYFVMELVKGVPVTRFCDERRLTPRERLELFVPVCQAVQHAHQKGVIHRDLKPSNVLVALYDGRPVPKVIDFGVAKATGEPLSERTLVTGLGAVVGTPEYMSPEQAELNQLDIDTRSDVYSLGVLLYELLTGTTPLQRKRVKEAALLEVLRLVREEEPPRPSTRLSTTDELPSIAANRGVEPRQLSGLVRGELDWIVMKALEKDRTRRYETANGFAADVLRFLSGEAVLAVPPSAGYRLRKFARRNRGPVLAATAAGALLVAAAGVAWYADRQAAERRLEAAERERDEQARLGRNGEAVAALLDQCEEALRADRADRAAIALGAAERRAAEGGAENLSARLDHFRGDLRLLRELDTINTDMLLTVRVNATIPKANAEKWMAALAEYGCGPDVPPRVAAGRVRGAPIRERVLTALDLWLVTEPSAWLRAVLRDADPEPFRDQVRDALAVRDGKAVTALAGLPEALAQPPAFAAVLGQLDEVPVPRRRAVLAAALPARPGDLTLLLTLGRLARADGQDGAGEQVRWCQAAVAAHPESLAACTNLGAALRKKGDPDGAIVWFKEALRLDDTFARGHYNMGIAVWDKGDLDGAIVWFKKAVALERTFAPAHHNLGNALWAKDDIEGAIAEYQAAIHHDDTFALAHNALGGALLRQGDRAGAIVAYRKATHHDPNFVEAHYNLGIALQVNGQPGEAAACFRDVIRLDEKQVAGHNNLAWVLATGPNWLRKGRQAVEHATRACVLSDFKNPICLATLAAAHAEAGNFNKAVEFQKKALESTDYPKQHATLGREQLQLYQQSKPYQDPTLAAREVLPPPREEKR